MCSNEEDRFLIQEMGMETRRSGLQCGGSKIRNFLKELEDWVYVFDVESKATELLNAQTR